MALRDVRIGQWWDRGICLLGDIVGAVGKRGGGGGQNLEERVGVLGLVIVLRGGVVNGLEVAHEHRVGLMSDDFLVDTVHDDESEVVPEVLDAIPWEVWVWSTLLLRLLLGGSSWARGIAGGLGGTGALLNIIATIGGWGSSGVVAVIEALVIVADDIVALWLWWHLTAAKEEGTVCVVVPLELPVLLDEETVEVWEEEKDRQEHDDTGNTKDAGKDVSSGEFGEGLGALPDDKHYIN